MQKNDSQRISQNVSGYGQPDRKLSTAEIQEVIDQFVAQADLKGRRILLIVPDGTRTMPMELFFRAFQRALAGKAAALDVLIALGTHQPMTEEAINRHFGISAAERAGVFANIKIFNHPWSDPATFVTLDTISREESLALSNSMLAQEVPVRINKRVLDYDVLLVCGPVFPHEVAGFSGGAKYFFPGISGPEVINYTHWLGALITSYKTIGIKDTPVRRVMERAAAVIPTPKWYICPVVTSEGVFGLFAGDPQAAWSAAADLSAQVHIRMMEKPFRQVLSVMPEMYDDIWTGAKGMYKLEPVVADGGEIIIYAPHITEFSYTHGKVIAEIGYHVRDYFVNQWERFKDQPWGVMAHSTHLRGMGTYENGIELPRIWVTLATGISRERCESVHLGYRDPASIHPQDWANREDEGILLVPHAGETLYRIKSSG